jgi:hypothetical protein
LKVWRLSHSRQAKGANIPASDNAWACEMRAGYTTGLLLAAKRDTIRVRNQTAASAYACSFR